MKTNIRNRIIAIFVIIFTFSLIFIFFNLLTKNMDLKYALENQNQVEGSWTTNINTFLSIEYGEGSNMWVYSINNKKVASGKIAVDEGDSYQLLVGDKVYAKIIPSYKKIYLVEKDLNIIELRYYADYSVYPAEG